MRIIVVTIAASAALLLSTASVSAQTKGRVSIGGSVTFVAPTDSDVASTVSAGPLVRLNPRKGFGVSAALNWFRADLDDPAGGEAPFARLRVRPVMVGAGYTAGTERTLVTFSVVGGPSFNSADFEEDFLRDAGGSPAIDVENSFVVRPGVGVTHAFAERVAIVGFGGYMFNRPDIVYRDAAGQQFVNRWRADSLVLSVGVVYYLF